jgi:hypothetical protein
MPPAAVLESPAARIRFADRRRSQRAGSAATGPSAQANTVREALARGRSEHSRVRGFQRLTGANQARALVPGIRTPPRPMLVAPMIVAPPTIAPGGIATPIAVTPMATAIAPMPIAALVPTVADGLDAAGIGLAGTRGGDARGRCGCRCGKGKQQRACAAAARDVLFMTIALASAKCASIGVKHGAGEPGSLGQQGSAARISWGAERCR